MVWVQFPGLSLEYWDEKTLFKISRAIRNPIKVDAATLNYQSGYYAKVLIEIDVAKNIHNKLWIVTRYEAFSQGVTLTNLPKFCHKCKIVGHQISECRINKQASATDGQKSSNSTPTKNTHNDTSTPQVTNQPALVPILSPKPVEISQFSSPSTSNIPKDMNSLPPAEANTNGEIPFIEVIRGVSNPGLNPISTPAIQINNNLYEVLQDNDSEYYESEDGEIKEVSTSSLLKFGSISQPVTILQKEKVISQVIPEINENSKVAGKKKPPIKPAVVTRKASK
ncbi:uncharacterized protein LOC113290894 [Papaver somniferum]|uniref:uncharacterized protein LOC113290894 n=1 Tax=Papaver somniferum TaxID=3469 RepID=UPI000E6FE2FB|nr:uncharacterized protein LOC113290894 [Papaver somniferum]